MPHDSIERSVERQRATLLTLSHDIHADPEIGFNEVRAVRKISTRLAQEGFAPEIDVYGLDTALIAVHGESGPTVAFMAEYDALTDIGHACGHNIIGSASTGAFIALVEAMKTHGIAGRAILLGTPAEENGSGKELLARAGAFHDVDAAFMLHPIGGSSVAQVRTTGLREVELIFHGRASHAAAAPERGANALDAVVAAYQGIAALRQHILPGDRVHGVITDGGDSANVIPDRAAAHFLVRSAELTQLDHLAARVEEIARAAATMHGVRVEVVWDRCPPCLPLRPNTPLAERFVHWMAERGRAVALSPATGDSVGGSTDAGNISVRIPVIHPMIAIAPADVPPHTAEFVLAAVSAEGDALVLDGASALAHTALDYLQSAELRAAVAREFGTPAIVDE